MADHLSTYLNDHLAGSVAGLEILDEIIEENDGLNKETLRKLKEDIEEDRDELAAIMHRLDISESALRKASAWLGEKAAELKMRVDDPGEGSFRLFQSLEALTIGIFGKLCLWRALKTAARENPELGATDYQRFIKRARQQRKIVERLRTAAARDALNGEITP